MKSERKNHESGIEMAVSTRSGSSRGGLVVVGAQPSCGKTVLATGLACVLGDQGASVRVLKPLGIGPHKKDSAEMTFMSIVGKTPVNYELIRLDFPPHISESRWAELVLAATAGGGFQFLELPGTFSTPLSFARSDDGKYRYTRRTVSDLVRDLSLPCLLVSGHTIDCLEQMDVACTYLTDRGVDVAAVATVETNRTDAQIVNDRISSDDFALFVTSRLEKPFLGTLRHSDSISVPRVNQGNLKKTVSNDIDLLALRQTVNLPI